MKSPTSSLPVVWHEAYEVDIGPHVFPTRKYRLVRDRLLEEGTIGGENLRTPAAASDEDVARAHAVEYLRKIKSGDLTVLEQMTLEVPFSQQLRDAMWLCAGGSILTGKLALEGDVAVHLGGGFHHAFADHGEGFCLINDVAIAMRALQEEQLVRKAAVVDLDVHHGNGTAAIFARDPEVFTLSVHQERNYPAWKPASDSDTGLDDGTADAEYIDILDGLMTSMLESHRPDLVFYLAGADPYEQDQLGGLGLTIGGLRRRDELVFERCTATKVPIAVTLAGGYAVNPDDTVEIHCGTVRAAAEVVGAR